MTQSIHKVVVLGLCVFVALLIASPIQADEKVKLTGEEIKEFTKPGSIAFGIDHIMNTIWICEELGDGNRRAFWRDLAKLDISGEITGTGGIVGDQYCEQWPSLASERCYDVYRIGEDKYQLWKGETLWHTWYRAQSKQDTEDKVKLTGRVLAEEKAYVPKDNEELYGTWVNEDYGSFLPQKYVYKSDGTYGNSMRAEDEPSFYHPYEIKEKWTDSEGNIWYKFYLEGAKTYNLCKLSNSGNTYEVVYDYNEYPTKFDKSEYLFVIRYRQ